jgi:hypothetical protein
MKAYTAYAMVWLSVSAAVCIALWLTKDISALWAFLLPGFISLKTTYPPTSGKSE